MADCDGGGPRVDFAGLTRVFAGITRGAIPAAEDSSLLRYGLRALHIALVTGALYLIYGAVASFGRGPDVAAIALPAAAPAGRSDVTLVHYQPIAERNLFHATTNAPPSELEPTLDESLEESALKFRLLGTIASPSSAYAVATLEDEQTREHLHVRVGDPLGESQRITVARIDRRLIVIDNKDRGQLETITMDDEQTTTQASSGRGPRPRAAARPRNRPARSRGARGRTEALERIKNLSANARRLASPGTALPPEVAQMLADSAPIIQSLLDQLQLSPSFSEDGAPNGMKVDRVTAGSPVAAAGVQPGDIVKRVNGIELTSVQDLPRILPTLTESDETCLEVLDANGAAQTRCWTN